VLRTLKIRSILPLEIANLFFHLKRVGNAAVHENVGTTADALSALKIARGAAVGFRQSYGGEPTYRPGPFVPPTPPVDATSALKAELEELRKHVHASSDEAAKALLAFRDSEDARLRAISEAEAHRLDKEFWESYAAETEVGLRKTEAALKASQAAAESAPPLQLDLLAQFANQRAQQVELDEATTRILIDDQLRAAGWTVDSQQLRYSTGVRPQPGQAIAIAEWPTDSGPVDYALFIEGRCVGVIEAKRGVKDVPGRLGSRSAMHATSG
jgi:type I restriction enzyme, R subunit